MALVVDFVDYFPTNTQHPWTEVIVSQAVSPDKVFVEIDRLPYNASGVYKTEKATLPEGWYRLDFTDAQQDVQPTRPWPMWAPSVQDVADLCPSYTRAPIEAGGGAKNVFDESTFPTATTVQGFIDAAVLEVNARAGVVVSARTADLANRAATWHAKILVETEVGSERADDTESGVRLATVEFLNALNELREQARTHRGIRLV